MLFKNLYFFEQNTSPIFRFSQMFYQFSIFLFHFLMGFYFLNRFLINLIFHRIQNLWFWHFTDHRFSKIKIHTCTELILLIRINCVKIHPSIFILAWWAFYIRTLKVVQILAFGFLVDIFEIIWLLRIPLNRAGKSFVFGWTWQLKDRFLLWFE